LIGHDYYWQNQLMKGETIVNKKENPAVYTTGFFNILKLVLFID
jgi:hypothetical protein